MYTVKSSYGESDFFGGENYTFSAEIDFAALKLSFFKWSQKKPQIMASVSGLIAPTAPPKGHERFSFFFFFRKSGKKRWIMHNTQPDSPERR